MTEPEDPLAFFRGCFFAAVITIVTFFLVVLIPVAVLLVLARYGLWPTP
jgi:hypothetical protein